MPNLIPLNHLERRIYFVRGHKVMLDEDLAFLYGVPTGRLNEQVKRNIERFPKDFMFQLTIGEAKILRSQIATSSSFLRSQIAILKTDRRGQHRKYLPLAFTEQGVAIILLLMGGDKGSQKKDIRKAQEFWANYKRGL